ncbi:MAG: 2-iminoacetate synthase ThiH [Bacteroidetes bacterium]|nr:MAG: 2-iminoacetate synthase ThiH [Bacteroidota bacterium]
MTFEKIFDTFDWEEVKQSIYSKTSSDLELALRKKGKRTLEDFKALISPAASDYLEEMAQLSHSITQKRFGKTLQMYIPLYLSNECQNICMYCGFSFDNKIARRTLNDEEILREVAVIKSMGYDHVLLVTGEANKTVGVSYLANAVQLIRPHFSNISMEVQPLEQEEYKTLISLGVYSVLVYQETYNRDSYAAYHIKGKKSNFLYRLDTPERLGRAGAHKIGLGVLIGLDDWRTDSFFSAIHLDYLEKIFWQTKYSISFPRLRPHISPASPGIIPDPAPKERGENSLMTDKELTQLICAYRIFNEEVELSLSTRESPAFRDNIIKLGITSVSAGSKTNPGGYASAPESLEQFEIHDERSPQQIASMIRAKGYEAVWKDWDSSLTPGQHAL